MSLAFEKPNSCLLAIGMTFKNYCVLILRKTMSILHSNDTKEMPIYASFKKASYTIEAAIIIPVFISIIAFGMFTFRVLQVQSGMQQSIDTASRTMAVSLGASTDSDETESNTGLLASTIALATAEIVKNSVPLEFIDGGVAGINFLESSADGNYIDVQVSYKMTFPVGLLGKFSFDVNQRARNRKWVGYDVSENSTDGMYVYITEYGQVYHTNYYCTYLNPSVHIVSASEIADLRNENGAIYYQCKRCKSVASTGVLYITDYGTAYHTDVNCTEIKHNIQKVLYEEVKDTMSPCSKCAAGVSH